MSTWLLLWLPLSVNSVGVHLTLWLRLSLVNLTIIIDYYYFYQSAHLCFLHSWVLVAQELFDLLLLGVLLSNLEGQALLTETKVLSGNKTWWAVAVVVVCRSGVAGKGRPCPQHTGQYFAGPRQTPGGQIPDVCLVLQAAARCMSRGLTSRGCSSAVSLYCCSHPTSTPNHQPQYTIYTPCGLRRGSPVTHHTVRPTHSAAMC